MTNNYIFTDLSIETSEGLIVMHEWERSIMEEKANWVCQNGGDIIEFGFGMGISAGYIQQHEIKSHTICESHPEVLKRLKTWSKDKPNVKILKGNWFNNISKMSKYDGVLFDTYGDDNLSDFPKILPNICNNGAAVTWWNAHPEKKCCFGEIPAQEYKVIEVDPPANDYFNHKQYYLPKYVHTF